MWVPAGGQYRQMVQVAAGHLSLVVDHVAEPPVLPGPVPWRGRRCPGHPKVDMGDIVVLEAPRPDYRGANDGAGRIELAISRGLLGLQPAAPPQVCIRSRVSDGFNMSTGPQFRRSLPTSRLALFGIRGAGAGW